jgi:hypothetical protein
MGEASKSTGAKEIELKRIVMVKAIVTDAFKGNLTRELERAIKNIETQEKQIEFQSKSHVDDLKKKGLMQQLNSFLRQLDEEKGKMAAAKADLTNKIGEAKALKIGSEFVQGPLEGPVKVRVGDNLYEKIGAAEIIVKDGSIQEIRGSV